jgi:hypothetical protein
VDTGWTNDPDAAALADPDFDGTSTWLEWLTSTDPLDSNSVLSIAHIEDAVVSWRSWYVDETLPPFVVQRSTNLPVGGWENVGPTVSRPTEPGAGPFTNTWVDPSPTDVPAAYRLYVPTP